MSVIEVDPRVQAAFDERVAAARRANAEVAGTLQASRERLAAEAREREERFAAERARMREKSQRLVAEAEKPQRPQWERPQSSGELAFGPEEDDAPPPPAAAPTPVYAPPPARPAPRRPAPVDDDEDFGTQSWLT
ncbi:hypothetical protein [Saccharothrix coeruleofusca]|uniref:Uncharacterized protein n=1 Tax=Saccharothrix coeruleofusca TaxID=33919 RepID=A0A918EF58_9PSEU|nr:hypothetical protein [Saccharothrix coeruleofusca]MBP2339347.1 hypothetical protein [Saccharothrix coeruleofusca]GGP58368.1 hypothetical protein GCM10010185_33530 [Saccharothrix coeruleofusca]